MYSIVGCHVHRGIRVMTDAELQRLVDEISTTYFKRTFKHRAFFNPRLRTTGGRYMLRSHNIEVNKKYYEQFGYDELVGIIKHELCHYHLHLEGKGYKHKDPEFKYLLKKVGGPRFCSSLPTTSPKPLKIHLYECRQCHTLFHRRRKMDVSRYACGSCRGRLRFLETKVSESK